MKLVKHWSVLLTILVLFEKSYASSDLHPDHHEATLSAYPQLQPYFFNAKNPKSDEFIPSDIVLECLEDHVSEESWEDFVMFVKTMNSSEVLSYCDEKYSNKRGKIIRDASIGNLCLITDIIETSTLPKNVRRRKELEKLYLQYINPAHLSILAKVKDRLLSAGVPTNDQGVIAINKIQSFAKRHIPEFLR